MNLIESIILGIVQGLTEFLPVSSSGHLVIVENILGLKIESLSFEVFVHFGTLLSVIVIYYQDIISMLKSFFTGLIKPVSSFRKDFYFRLSILVLIGTIPAALAGVFLEDFFKSIFHNTTLVGVMLLITGLILWSTRYIEIHNQEINLKNAIIIGIAQMFAIFPGISRSGITISSGLFSKMSRKEAARFSFLLAIPAITGSMLFTVFDLISQQSVGLGLGILITGLITSFIVGLLAIKFLLKVLESGKFSLFAPYCIMVAILVLIFL
jgi:undecaprenyl-diphosphatase